MAHLGLTNSRKRCRGNCDEISEFTPLSKRINNLHINSSIPLPKEPNNVPIEQKEMHRSIIVNNERLDYEGSRNMDGSDMHQQQWLPQYTPDLSPAENPFYYDSNRLLFQLYLERSQRNSSSNQF